MLRTSTSIGSASVPGRPPRDFDSPFFRSMTSRLAPRPFTLTLRDRSARGDHVTAVSRASTSSSSPCHAMRAMRTVDRSEPSAPSMTRCPSAAVDGAAHDEVERRLAGEEEMSAADRGDDDDTDRRNDDARAARGQRRLRGLRVVLAQNESPTEKCTRTLLVLLAVREVEAERADRRPQARADAVAERGIELGHLVARVAGVDERGDAPRLR